MNVGDLVKFAGTGKGRMAQQVGIVINLGFKPTRFSPWQMITIAEVQWPHGGTSTMRVDIFEVISESW